MSLVYMVWKLPAWLKGGIIAVIIALVFTIMAMIKDMRLPKLSPVEAAIIPWEILFAIIISTIFVFAIGAIIGLIIGRIKHK